MVDIKILNPNCTYRKSYQTFRNCKCCGKLFGPLNRLSQKFCSVECRRKGLSGRTKKYVYSKQAAKVSRHLRYLIGIGKVIRPKICEECGKQGIIEAAHYHYEDPLAIRWLCISCHRKWDRKQSKGGCDLVCHH
jgi:hypothetical protein